MHSSIGQNIKSLDVSGVQSGLSSPVTGVCRQDCERHFYSFMDRPTPNLEGSFYVWCTKRFFETEPSCHGNENLWML